MDGGARAVIVIAAFILALSSWMFVCTFFVKYYAEFNENGHSVLRWGQSRPDMTPPDRAWAGGISAVCIVVIAFFASIFK